MVRTIKSYSRDQLADFVAANVAQFNEEEALAVLENPHVTAKICQAIAQNPRLAAFYDVRRKLVVHRATPQSQAVRLIYYLHWPDLLAISVDMTVPPAVRRAADTQLLLRADKLTLGEKIASARRCSRPLIAFFLFDPDPNVFKALLQNQRLREEDLLEVARSPKASPEQLRLIGSDQKWSYRYPVRKALVMNPLTPNSTAASQLRFLMLRDLRALHAGTDTSVYLRRCIERMERWKAVDG